MPERTSCLFCRTPDEVPLLHREEPRHVVCRGCGLVYQNPRPTVSEMEDFYARAYWQKRESEAHGRVDIVERPSERSLAVERMLRGTVSEQSSIIDIGCGRGEILSHLSRSFKCRITGIEPSTEEACRTSERLGITIINGTLDSMGNSSNRFDVVILSHVLEHFHDPREAVRKCAALLSPNGSFFIEVPNMLRPNPKKRLANWLAIEHMYYFTPHNLERILREAGLRVTMSEITHVIRFLCRREDEVALEPNIEFCATNEYRSVRWAVRLHELRYWPAFLGRRIAAATLFRRHTNGLIEQSGVKGVGHQ